MSDLAKAFVLDLLLDQLVPELRTVEAARAREAMVDATLDALVPELKAVRRQAQALS